MPHFKTQSSGSALIAIRTLVAAFVSCVLIAACSGGGGDPSNNNPSSSINQGGSGGNPPNQGGPGGGAPASNVASISVGSFGNYVNGLTTSVTVCVPGTTTCQTIGNVLVDTGSYGLRIISPALNIALTGQTDTGGNSIGECTLFADGYAWGPVANADVRIAGEVASNIPIQIVGVPSFPAVPSACSSGIGNIEDTAVAFGVNGVLGIGTFVHDCGTTCATNSNANIYFACDDSTAQCTSTTQSLSNQVQNPVADFATDNNGVIIELPDIPDTGQVTAGGQLIFGIGTQSNNDPGPAQVLTLDRNGNFTTAYAGTSTAAFIDSGSNGLFFASSLPICDNATDFYCPASIVNLSAEMIGMNHVSVTVPFAVVNAETLPAGYAAFNDLAGPAPSTLSGFFDWGLPFFYGRTVFFALKGASTPKGVGPYVAY